MALGFDVLGRINHHKKEEQSDLIVQILSEVEDRIEMDEEVSTEKFIDLYESATNEVCADSTELDESWGKCGDILIEFFEESEALEALESLEKRRG